MVDFVPKKLTSAPGQRSINLDDAYLWRFAPPWSRPATYSAEVWRNFVKMQPVAVICRETLIANLLSLDWKISAKDSTMQDELKPTIKYYTRLFEKGAYGGLDYSGHMEWVCSDLLDLPFGAASELGRRNDEPGGRVYWIKPLDGGTLYPTLNEDFPVCQYYVTPSPVYFPAHAIDRVYMSPRTELLNEGWGMAPPEKIYFAIEMLIRGDKYYAGLLLDTPPAGVLDLGDMEQSAAVDWASAFKEMLVNGTDAFKIPVLYEHNNPVAFIPFGKVPNDIMYDRITLKYAAIVAAAYGMALSDIGIAMSSNGGETLAGTIRQERHTRKTGFARLKRKTEAYWNNMLPDTLTFDWIDLDDEVSTALGRARLANATAFNQLVQMQAFTPDEARLQIIADGLITVPVPEKMPEAEKKKLEEANQPAPQAKKAPERPGVLGTVGVAPSAGGIGEVKDSLLAATKNDMLTVMESVVADTVLLITPILAELSAGYSEDNMFAARALITKSVEGDDDLIAIRPVINEMSKKHPVKFKRASGLLDVVRSMLEGDDKSKANKLADKYLSDMSQAATETLIRCAVLSLKDLMLVDDDIDSTLDKEYDIVVDSLKEQLQSQVPMILDACSEVCTEKILTQVKMEA